MNPRINNSYSFNNEDNVNVYSSQKLGVVNSLHQEIRKSDELTTSSLNFPNRGQYNNLSSMETSKRLDTSYNQYLKPKNSTPSHESPTVLKQRFQEPNETKKEKTHQVSFINHKKNGKKITELPSNISQLLKKNPTTKGYNTSENEKPSKFLSNKFKLIKSSYAKFNLKKNEISKARPQTAKKDEPKIEMNRKAITPDRDGSTGPMKQTKNIGFLDSKKLDSPSQYLKPKNSSPLNVLKQSDIKKEKTHQVQFINQKRNSKKISDLPSSTSQTFKKVLNSPKTYTSVKTAENEQKKNEMHKPRPLTAKKDEPKFDLHRKAITPDRDGSTGKSKPTMTSLHQKTSLSPKVVKPIQKPKQPEAQTQVSITNPTTDQSEIVHEEDDTEIYKKNPKIAPTLQPTPRNQYGNKKSSQTFQQLPVQNQYFSNQSPQNRKSPTPLTKYIKFFNRKDSSALNGLVTSMKRGQIFPGTQPSVIRRSDTQTQNNNNRPQSPQKQIPMQTQTVMDTKYIYNIISPPFKGAIYYQTNLLFHHYEKIFGRPSNKQFQFELVYKDDQKNYFRDVYQEHFMQSFYCLKYCSTHVVPAASEDIRKKQINMVQSIQKQIKTNQAQKKTIVFDLDETLIHCADSPDEQTDYVIQINFTDGEIIQARINIRPYCREILQVLSENFEIVVFTASHQCYADRVIDLIDPDKKYIKYRLFRDNCIQAAEGLYIKDLRVLGNRDLNNVLIVDNAAYSFCHQIRNGVPIIPFYENKSDKELIYLADYLLTLKDQKDWISINAANFRLDLYSNSKAQEECLQKLYQFNS